MIYKTCPICGAALDPGERCDCNEYQNAATRGNLRQLAATRSRLPRKKEAAPVLQHQNGRVEKVLTAQFPPPILHEKKKNARRFA